VGLSPHFIGELAFREGMVKNVLEPSTRPFAEHGFSSQADEPGGYGAHCGLGDPGFASWTCAPGLRCEDLDGDVIGQCLPNGNLSGDPCERARVTPQADPRLDTTEDVRAGAEPETEDTFTFDPNLVCLGAGARCDLPRAGFPNGMCTTRCSMLGVVSGDVICGGIPSHNTLKDCFAENKAKLEDCIASDYEPTELRACDASRPCRDDYSCVRVENGPLDTGACMPPYFVFHARVDGHIVDP
jgi:hypothetical protein